MTNAWPLETTLARLFDGRSEERTEPNFHAAILTPRRAKRESPTRERECRHLGSRGCHHPNASTTTQPRSRPPTETAERSGDASTKADRTKAGRKQSARAKEARRTQTRCRTRPATPGCSGRGPMATPRGGRRTSSLEASLGTTGLTSEYQQVCAVRSRKVPSLAASRL